MTGLTLSGVVARLGERVVLDRVDLAASGGEMIVLCGPNGAGKTSLLKTAAGLLPLADGGVTLGGRSISALKGRALAERIAYLPQDRRIAWNLPAVEVAALGTPFDAPAQGMDRALRALDAVGAAHLARRGVAEMSGGERARVLFARFLATNAPVLLADEPAAGLDPDAQFLVLDLLRARAAAGALVVVTLHDLSLAARYADRVAVIENGRLVADGSPRTAFAPARLRQVFGVSGVWARTTTGPILTLSRST